MNKLIISISLLLLIFVLSAFQKQAENHLTIEELKEIEIEKQIERYSTKRMATCYRLAIEKAGQIVDSILIARAQSMLLVDTITKPPKPSKPIAPEAKIVEDTTPIAPLLDRTELEEQNEKEEN